MKKGEPRCSNGALGLQGCDHRSGKHEGEPDKSEGQTAVVDLSVGFSVRDAHESKIPVLYRTGWYVGESRFVNPI